MSDNDSNSAAHDDQSQIVLRVDTQPSRVFFHLIAGDGGVVLEISNDNGDAVRVGGASRESLTRLARAIGHMVGAPVASGKSFHNSDATGDAGNTWQHSRATQ